jgi:hypothetical protein
MHTNYIPCRTCKKPPLGIKPRWLHEEQRINAITAAIKRYLEEDVPIPQKWIEEYNELAERKNARN